MTLVGDVLREGLVYDMLHPSVEQDVRSRTLRSIQRRFMIDTEQAQRVASLASHLLNQLDGSWGLDPLSRDLLLGACSLHEIGLGMDFKHAPQHAAYLVNDLNLPDFTPTQKKLIATLFLNQTSAIDLSSLHQQNAVLPRVAEHLYRLLRLATLFASRRRDGLLPAIQLTAHDDQSTPTLSENWPAEHPLGREIVNQECQWQGYVHWTLRVTNGDTPR